MRQKFGGSSGLNSSGSSSRLQAIGSDPHYRPGTAGGSGGINSSEVTAKLQDASKQALSFLQNTVASISEKVKVSKVEKEIS